MKTVLRIGTRQSSLALWQSRYVADCLARLHPGLELRLERIVTKGDRVLDAPLAQIGGKGLFTKEIERALLNRQIDLAVHSLKDLPTQLPAGLCLGAVTQRAEAADAFVSHRYNTLASLPSGARVGTSSLRRQAQLLALRPDLRLLSVRGNVDTRLAKLAGGQVDALILAAAGLERLGYGRQIRELLPPSLILPAVGQGALAIECRQDDQAALELLAPLNHEVTALATAAERAFLEVVGGGCQVPIGVYGLILEGELTLEALIASLDGSKLLRQQARGRAAAGVELGRELAAAMLAAGGRAILAEIGLKQGDS